MVKINNNLSSVSYLIGITGSFGTGKNLAGDILKQYNVYVVDTDDIVKEILSSENSTSKQIVVLFGDSIVNKNSKEYINRQALSSIIFNDSSLRKKLESIIHPEVFKVLKDIISSNSDKKIIAVLIPLLFESGTESDYHETWCVICDKNVQLERLLKKGYLENHAKQRIDAQLPQEEKAKKADFVIDNSGTIENTKEQVVIRLKQLAQLDHNFHLFLDK